jgi:hypothetical protein
MCGPYSVKFILEGLGKRWRAAWPKWIVPSFPGRMVRMMQFHNQNARIERVRREKRIAWLKRQLKIGRMPALFVRKATPFPSHWIVVCGYDHGFFYVYDSSQRDSSQQKRLPIGNALFSPKRIESIWQAFPGLRNTSTAVITVESRKPRAMTGKQLPSVQSFSQSKTPSLRAHEVAPRVYRAVESR